jgi:hypothetical protein
MDKMEAHLRQQLSAMMDGALASDEARFLFRRLQHDRDLAGCWERWQVCSALLRGQGAAVLLPADFSRRVADAVALESSHSSLAGEHVVAATGTQQRRWIWWGGGAALAASLALLTVVPRPGSGPTPGAGIDLRVAARQPEPATPTPRPAAPAPAPARDPGTPPVAAGLATALAVADAPRRAAVRRSRSRAAAPTLPRIPPPAPVVAATVDDSGQRVAAADAQPLDLPKHRNPFAPQEALPARPWPRAVLPGANTGALTASYSTGATSAFYPFEPRSPALPEPQSAAGEQPEQP